MGGPTSRTNRSRLIYTALWVGSTAAALWISKAFNVARMAATALTLAPSLPGLYLAWRTYAASRTESSAESGHAETADLLAATVRRQWEAEAQLRRLNDPYPLPVSWQAADPMLVEEWPGLQVTARGWPAGPPNDPADWASSPAHLAGEDAQITEVLTRRVPTGRLVILGQPGVGKTMLLIRLVLSLLARRSSGCAVPVLVPLASWNPVEDELRAWLVHRLTTDYPFLSEAVSTAGGVITRAQALLNARLLLLVLDGLDEIPDPVRGAAIAKINDALNPGEGLVLSCRTRQYDEAIRPVGRAPVVLRGAAGIALQGLAASDVAAYLRRDAGPAAAPRWDPVLACLGTDAPVAEVLRTPLMVGLARTIYNPRPGEDLVTLPDPAHLCDTRRYRTPADMEDHLFDAFIPAAYRPHPQRSCPWTARRAERAFIYLARYLDQTLHGTIDIAWWELSRTVPRYLTLLASVLVSGIVFGVTGGIAGAVLFGTRFGLARGVEFGLVNGLVTGLAAVASSRSAPGPIPVAGLRWTWTRLVAGLAGGVAGGLAFGYAGGGLTRGLALGIAFGGSVGLAGALRRSPVDLAAPVGPRTLLKKDRNAFQVTVLLGGLAFGLLFAFSVADGLVFDLAKGISAGAPSRMEFGLTVGLTDGLLFGLAGGLLFVLSGGQTGALLRGLIFGLLTGLIFGVVFSLERGLTFGSVGGLAFGISSGLVFSSVSSLMGAVGTAAWGPFTVARIYLALRGQLPLRLMGFLADAHEHRGVLRQVGAVYQFRHVELQRHLSRRT